MSVADSTDLADLGQRLDLLWTLQQFVLEGDWPDAAAADAVYDLVVDAADDVMRRIAKLPAEDMAGLKVKARAYDWCREIGRLNEGGFDPLDYTLTDITGGMVDDLLRLSS